MGGVKRLKVAENEERVKLENKLAENEAQISHQNEVIKELKQNNSFLITKNQAETNNFNDQTKELKFHIAGHEEENNNLKSENIGLRN